MTAIFLRRSPGTAPGRYLFTVLDEQHHGAALNALITAASITVALAAALALTTVPLSPVHVSPLPSPTAVLAAAALAATFFATAALLLPYCRPCCRRPRSRRHRDRHCCKCHRRSRHCYVSPPRPPFWRLPSPITATADRGPLRATTIAPVAAICATGCAVAVAAPLRHSCPCELCAVKT